MNVMGINYNVSPGEILKEYMESRNIKQKELAEMISSSERHISMVVNGKAKITEEFAIRLEKAFPDVMAEFWLELENAYRLHLLRTKTYDEKELDLVNKFRLNEVFHGLSYNENQKIKELLNIAGVDSVSALEKDVKNLNVHLMHDTGNINMIYLWLKLAEEQVEIQNDLDKMGNFNIEEFKSRFLLIKKLLNTKDYILAIKNVKRYLNRLGVALVLEEALTSSKVRGAVTLYNNVPVIYLSTRHKRIDAIYFALVHEIYHIYNQDYLNNKNIGVVTFEDELVETTTNELTRDFFIKKEDFDKFVEKKDFSEEEIIIFSKSQGVVVDVVIGRLQHEEILSYTAHTKLRTYINEGGLQNVYDDIKK